MNDRIIEYLWKKLSKSKFGRFMAASLIGGLFGLSAGASQSHELFTIAMATAGGAVIALIAVAILEALDAGRASTPHQRETQREQLPPHLTPPKIDEVKTAPVPPRQSSPIPQSHSDP
ncbi:hypothetical protein [Pedosphaera parvula]|uniref:Uncharacterized protein n=1 Tax=Pedosphaera parvula (strain Ellin514) TaxID=320771 RepID=B9XHU2_PEDPL|nr:hypothetical protein [Pedosphaera parvula]EEF60670.1 hypothetical protein Cflav_PD6261 [Pedosphaera parvula Ellin514]